MSDVINCSPLLHNISVGMGENHEIILRFDNDVASLEKYTLSLTVRSNNNDGDVLLTQKLNIVNGVAIFSLYPDDTYTKLGEGLYYYDIWITDNADYSKAIIYGTLKIVRYTRRSALV